MSDIARRMHERIEERRARALAELGWTSVDQVFDHSDEVVQQVVKIFGRGKSALNLTLWLTSNNGALEGSARPIDMLEIDPERILTAARLDAMGSGI